jgi:heme-degrading monooxygenase HmoA
MRDGQRPRGRPEEASVIARHWRCVARQTEVDSYLRHLRQHIFPQFAGMRGFVSASVLRRTVPSGVEVRVVTTWRSLEAIRQFSGDTSDVAVVPQVVQAMMVEFDRTVAHYEVVETFTPG